MRPELLISATLGCLSAFFLTTGNEKKIVTYQDNEFNPREDRITICQSVSREVNEAISNGLLSPEEAHLIIERCFSVNTQPKGS